MDLEWKADLLGAREDTAALTKVKGAGLAEDIYKGIRFSARFLGPPPLDRRKHLLDDLSGVGFISFFPSVGIFWR